MAAVEQPVFIKEDSVFVDYLPINLHEEEVTTEIQDELFLMPLEVGTEVVLGNNEAVDNMCELDEYSSLEEGTTLLEKGPGSEESLTNIKEEFGIKISSTSYTSASDKRHAISNVKEKPLKNHGCYHCTKSFSTQDKMLRHVKLFHKENVTVRIDRDGKRCWVCTSCNKTFISRKGSIIHQRTHTGERPYLCTICSKRFIDSSTLMKHQVIHQAIRPFACQICKRGFNQKVALQRHERTHLQQQVVYICNYCPKTFLVMSSLQAHEKIHSGVKPFSCRFCPSSFHTSTAQRQHERVHTNERPYACTYCPKAFNDSGTLLKHQAVHSDPKPFVCPVCSQAFNQKIAVKKHIRMHVVKSEITSCSLCENLTFITKDELCEHFEKHVEDDPKLLQRQTIASTADQSPNISSLSVSDLSDLTTLCDVAISTAKNLTFSLSSNNNNQLDSVKKSGDKMFQYSCSECGMGFKRLKSLKSHLLGHSLMCKHCDKVYSDRSLLEEHEKLLCNNVSNNNNNNNLVISSYKLNNKKRVNKLKTCSNKLLKTSSKRQFFCEKCDKYFSSRNGYMIHQRCHTGERPYRCRWCEKAFGDSATRHKHERIHTGERPFQCVQCPRAFNQRAALRAHQITHSADRGLFICPYCAASFPYAATLKRHCFVFHNESQEINCPICDKLTSDTNSLHNHIINYHCDERTPSNCPLCISGLFTDVNEFSDHIVWHARQIASRSKCDKLKGVEPLSSKRVDLSNVSCN